MSNAQTITGDDLTAGSPTDPLLCRVSGYLIDIFGNPLKGQEMVIRNIYNPIAVGTDTLVGQELQKAKSDQKGYIQFDVLRESTVRVELHNRVLDMVRVMPVPDLANIDIGDFLFPYVVSLAFDQTDPIAAVVDEIFTVSVTATLSNGTTLDGTVGATFESADEGVAVLRVNTGFVAIGTGSTTISVSEFRPESLDFNTEPDGDQIQKLGVPAVTLPTPITVNVT